MPTSLSQLTDGLVTPEELFGNYQIQQMVHNITFEEY